MEDELRDIYETFQVTVTKNLTLRYEKIFMGVNASIGQSNSPRP
jgi:hypothetical protein